MDNKWDHLYFISCGVFELIYLFIYFFIYLDPYDIDYIVSLFICWQIFYIGWQRGNNTIKPKSFYYNVVDFFCILYVYAQFAGFPHEMRLGWLSNKNMNRAIILQGKIRWLWDKYHFCWRDTTTCKISEFNLT